MAISNQKDDQALEARFLAAYDVYAPQILRHISFRVEDEDAAKDLTSEVFMKAWQSLCAGTDVRDFKSFFYTIAKNTIIDHYRTRHQNAIPLEEMPEAAEPRSALPDDRLDAQAAVSKILDVHLDALPPGHKEILIYRYVDELDVGEIRELTGKSLPSIYTTIHRALKALRKKLGDS